MMEIADCIALRDYVGVGTNGLNRIKQAIEALVPVLKNLLLLDSQTRNRPVPSMGRHAGILIRRTLLVA